LDNWSTAVVDYETFCQIRDHLGRQQLTVAQTARALALHPRTVAKWAGTEQFRPRAGTPRTSKLDAFKGHIVRWLDAHPYSAQQIFQRLGEAGYGGGISIVKDYVHRIRPRHQEAFLTLDFAAGEAAQIDWGEWGTIGVGSTRRRLSFFLMVLCYSRRMYLEFTVSQKMEFFLACHENAFATFGGVPTRLIVDNLKSAVLQRLVGEAPVFNPKYLDFSKHWGFKISACNVRAGQEKGRVENGVGYVKKNLLAGLELPDFCAMQPAATVWVNTVADVRLHRETHQRPIDRFEDERAHLLPLNPVGFDLARVCLARATKRFRVPLDSNHYTVPWRYAGLRLTLKAHADRVCIYDGEQLIASHPRSMDRHKDIEDPDHERQLMAQRKTAREQRLMVNFLALSPRAQAYLEGLHTKQVNARVHVRKILALVELHGKQPVVRALDDGLELQAFSAEYIANILAARRRIGPEPAALQLTRRADLLELEIPEPDLSIYDRNPGEIDGNTP
jgi:transposase